MISLRSFRIDDTAALFELFRGTILRVNSRDYSPEQVAAWAPPAMDVVRWSLFTERFTVVAEIDGIIAGFTDFEPDGHIDRFFVHADFQRRGVGSAMMRAVEGEASRLRLDRIFAEVSITARPFFESQGFSVLAEQQVVLRGVSLTNFRMEKSLVLRREASDGKISPQGGPLKWILALAVAAAMLA